MELKLIVLAGAKEGLEIPLKKEKFLIGRAKECSLRAGSEAISRRHCALVLKDSAWTARDLGSRNGTYVNDTRITEEVTLRVGDELRVGPLRFRIAAKEGIKPPLSASADPNKARKQPPVKDVADVIQRTVNKSEGATSEDDISRWLFGMPDTTGEGNLKETMTLQLDETTAHGRIAPLVEPPSEVVTDDDSSALSTGDTSASGEVGEETKSGWSFFKRSKNAAPKKSPGKLPPRPEQQTKDSREAAADILREMNRRR